MKIDALLNKPQTTCGESSALAMQAFSTPAKYKKAAGEHALANANKPIEELMKDIYGEQYQYLSPESYVARKVELEEWIAEHKDKETPGGEETPGEDETPGEEKTPGEEETTEEEENPMEDENPKKVENPKK